MDYLDWIKKYIPEQYWGPLEGHNGWEIFQTIAEIASVVSDAIDAYRDSYNPLRATGGTTAIAEVLLHNTDTVDVTVFKDETKIQNPGGYQFVARSQVTVPAGGYASLEFESLAADESYNFNQYRIDDWEVVQDMYGWEKMEVTSVTLSRQAVSPTLDILAAERKLTRNTDESDDELRDRLHTLSITITNQAIADLAAMYNLTVTVADAYDVYEWSGPFVGSGYVGFAELYSCTANPWFLINVLRNSADPNYESNLEAYAARVYTTKAAGIGMAIQDDNSKCINYSGGLYG